MSKITIGTIFEISKALSTKAGRELQEPLNFLADLGEQTIRAIKAINFRDNFDGDFKNVELTHGIDQVVQVTKSPVDIWVTRTVSKTAFVTSFGWYINDDSQLIVNASFVGAPTDPVTTRIAVVY